MPHCVARRFIGVISRVCTNDVFALCRSLLKMMQLMSSSLLSTLIRHDNGAFQKRSSNQRNLKTLALRFSVDGKNFGNGSFQKRGHHDNLVISRTEFSSD